LEFGGPQPLGASQVSSSTASTSENPSSSLGAFQSSSLPAMTVTASPVPTGAQLRPNLRSLFRSRGPILQTRQLWEGTVIEVRNGGFVAVVNDKTNPANPEEQVSFDFGDLSDEDHSLVSLGSPFYWIIGRERTPTGTVKNVSFVQFRRLPSWTPSALSKVSDRARRFKELLRAEE
jgi:hypothetical protein